MTLESLARRDVVFAARDESISEIATMMHDENVGSVVITEGSVPVGIVTDRDIAVRVVAEAHDPSETTAEAVMTEDIVTAPIDTGLFELTETMEEHGVRRMPVVEDDELAGIITLDDVTQLLVDELDNLGQVIKAESPEY